MNENIHNITCTCGHEFNCHNQWSKMHECLAKTASLFGFDMCIEYTPDNLKYLERKHKEKKRGK